jgi:hypothetical protein
MARKNCVLLDTGRRETAATTRDGEKSLLLLDAGRQETTAVDVRWRNPLLLDAERRETTSAGGAAINCCCWTRDGKKSLLLDVGCWQEMTAAGRGTARSKPLLWTQSEETHCCSTPNGEKPILLVAGRREITPAGRGTARNHSCWTRDGETPLNQHCWPRDGEKLLLLDEIWREPTAVGLLLDVDRREITAAGRARHHCVLLETGRRETAAAMRDGVKQLLLGLGGEKSLLLDAGLREMDEGQQEMTAAGCQSVALLQVVMTIF